MSHFVLFRWIVMQTFIVHTASETVVRGMMGQPVTLPCSYRVAREKDISDMCWGRGPCPNSKCNNKLLHTTGNRVTFRTSQRYNLQGYVSYGDVSLTIQELKAEDAGTYCCRVEIPGWFNDIKQNIQLVVLRATSVKKKPKKNGSKSTKRLRKTTFAPQTTSDLQGTEQTAVFLATAVPPAASATTESPRVTTAFFPPMFDQTASDTSLEKAGSTSALPDFSASFQAVDVRTDGDGISYSTELILLPEATTLQEPTILQTPKSTFSPSAMNTASETVVRGMMGQPVTLPCSYRVAREKDISDMCWGRGPCPNSKCNNKLLHTTGNRVTFRTSQRYNLQGYVSYGDVSLTIQELKAEDAGTYCCRVEIPGWFNDIKQNIQLVVLRAPPVMTTTGKPPTSPSHFGTTTFAAQETPDLQATTWAAVPSAGPTTTWSPPTFDKTTSNNFLEKAVTTSAPPDFSTDFQTSDAWTEGESVFCSTQPVSPPRVTSEFPSILLTADGTEEATFLWTDDVPTVAMALREPTTFQTPKSTLGPSGTTLSSASNTEKAGMKLSFRISTILTVSLIGIFIILMLILLSLLWKRRHTRKFIMKSLRPAEDLEKVFSGSEGENNLFVL
ncbi:T-cell immunoglobulin and mucin domain-containing protein 4-like isoform X2 [Centrocercus urophasianus]|uniref:T-cell immunoglobulin and mucin domain-containing protein 4-like isoform X2 n=1 Tax=Centrocercus urophasianus TaxID=9002 RepID=UPI001C64985B|nr:T-cell immunoglobulin and mucin domain-containing protein 4-like isoform X2 [Centrocercus urophasianus]